MTEEHTQAHPYPGPALDGRQTRTEHGAALFPVEGEVDVEHDQASHGHEAEGAVERVGLKSHAQGERKRDITDRGWRRRARGSSASSAWLYVVCGRGQVPIEPTSPQLASPYARQVATLTA